MNDPEELLREFTEHYARSLDAAHQLREERIVVIGLGAVGSLTALELAHHGCSLDLIDRDVVDAANQARHVLSERRYLNEPKAAALAAHIRAQVPSLQDIRSLVVDINLL